MGGMPRRQGALISQANALQLPLRDASVDLIVTSPPLLRPPVLPRRR
jgi:hypothetical protein